MFRKLYDRISGGLASFFNDLNKKYLVGRILTSLYFGFKGLYERVKVWPHIPPDVFPNIPDSNPDDNPNVPVAPDITPEKIHWWQLWKRFKNKK